MKLNDILARLHIYYQSGVCFYFTSAPGMGKTTTVEHAPEVIKAKLGLNIGLVVLNGGLLTPMDMLGFGLPKHEGEYSTMVFSLPFFFKTAEGKFLWEYDGGIIFIDEADKMDTDVKKIAGEGAHSHRFGPHILPKGWVVWMAGNRSEDRSGSTKELDHLINRRCEVPITADLPSWVTWAEANHVAGFTIVFAQNFPQVVWPDKVPDKQGPYCTPRSLVRADKYLQLLASMNMPTDDDAAISEVSGMIGPSATSQYFTSVRLDKEMPKYADIVKDPMGVKVSDKPDACMLICYNLAHMLKSEDVEPVIKYVNRLPKEFACTFARAAIKRDPLLVMAPAMKKWTFANSHLLNAINNA